MPYPYPLPTTSPVAFVPHYTSPVYPSLPLLCTQHRGTLRNLLKAFKRASPAQQSTQLPQLLQAIETYLPYLLFLQSSLHSGDVLASDSPTPLTTSWRTTLTAPSFPGAPPKRVEREGLDYEILFVLNTLAYVHTLLARSQLHDALAPSVQTEKKQSLLNTAIQHLLTSSAIFTFAVSLPRPPAASEWPPDLSPAVLSALASLSLADATLLAVTKQDPYPTYLLVSSGQGSDSTSLLYAPPAPPTGVKALLLARICIAASSHAEAGTGLLASSSSRRKRDDEEVVPDLGRYLDSLQKVARAKCCRFLSIDAEASGRVGEGIGWATLARSILSPTNTGKLKREFLERRENKALERGDASWGLDAGKLEEGRTLERLEEKWRKSNDAVFFQPVDGANTLAARIPSGREVHTVKNWEPLTLDPAEKKALLGKSFEGLQEALEEMGWGDSDEEEERKGGGTGSMSGGYIGRSATATPGYY
ncbi:hypothetical protein FN846DRAFT_505130 [Sphaerosporella brunnea]|uniref:pH-response regulator protein palC n=1 Tax=Sphaerosporella brunnea TaxID=1250544 RepID=A0A5J5EDE7_9PEZI|nr:hypothetical protein FN846DRAFT_505130 [Sphaerosporella brunnea]